jgi:hypothetical protein
MTLEKLQNIVINIANHSYCRYWAHYNYPCKKPWLMAINVSDYIPQSFFNEMRDLGFDVIHEGALDMFVIERTFNLKKP